MAVMRNDLPKVAVGHDMAVADPVTAAAYSSLVHEKLRLPS
jgi:hypothetical protein